RRTWQVEQGFERSCRSPSEGAAVAHVPCHAAVLWGSLGTCRDLQATRVFQDRKLRRRSCISAGPAARRPQTATPTGAAATPATGGRTRTPHARTASTVTRRATAAARR